MRHMSNSFQRIMRLLAILGCLSVINACSWMNYHNWFGGNKTCVDTTSDYLHVEDRPLLKVPAGVDTPDRQNLFTVPEVKSKDAKGKCLDKSPSYFGYAGRIAASPEETVADWAQAWAEGNVDGVMSMYATNYGSQGPVTSLDQRRVEIATGPLPDGRIRNLVVRNVDNDHRLAQFTQKFGDTDVVKHLLLVREGGLWKIEDEKVITTK